MLFYPCRIPLNLVIQWGGRESNPHGVTSSGFYLISTGYEYLLEETLAMLAGSLIYPHHTQQLHELCVAISAPKGP